MYNNIFDFVLIIIIGLEFTQRSHIVLRQSVQPQHQQNHTFPTKLQHHTLDKFHVR